MTTSIRVTLSGTAELPQLHHFAALIQRAPRRPWESDLEDSVGLADGTWITDCRDGVYHDHHGIQWAALMADEVDADGEVIEGVLLGYVRV